MFDKTCSSQFLLAEQLGRGLRRRAGMKKYLDRIERYGLLGAIRIAVGKSSISHRRKRILGMATPRDRFTAIFQSNHWNNPESISGEGSTLENTESLRTSLPTLFDTFGIGKVLDAPCGDFNWMRDVVSRTEIEYLGGIKFIQLDITCDPLPNADLMICRDCLFHLSYRDIFSFLNNFIQSSIPLLLTSTHPNSCKGFVNSDIKSGDFRAIDLFSDPFSFRADVLETIDDTQVSSATRKQMILVDASEVRRVRDRMNEKLGVRFPVH